MCRLDNTRSINRRILSAELMMFSPESFSELIGEIAVAFGDDSPIRECRSKRDASVGQEHEGFCIATESDVRYRTIGKLHASLAILDHDVVCTGRCPGQLKPINPRFLESFIM